MAVPADGIVYAIQAREAQMFYLQGRWQEK